MAQTAVKMDASTWVVSITRSPARTPPTIVMTNARAPMSSGTGEAASAIAWPAHAVRKMAMPHRHPPIPKAPASQISSGRRGGDWADGGGLQTGGALPVSAGLAGRSDGPAGSVIDARIRDRLTSRHAQASRGFEFELNSPRGLSGCGRCGSGRRSAVRRFRLPSVRDAEHRLAMLASHQLPAHVVRHRQKFSAPKVGTDQLYRHVCGLPTLYRPFATPS